MHARCHPLCSLSACLCFPHLQFVLPVISDEEQSRQSSVCIECRRAHRVVVIPVEGTAEEETTAVSGLSAARLLLPYYLSLLPPSTDQKSPAS
jgi:hypothetical protein